MIAIIDYGMGNLRSVQKALEKAGAKTTVTQNPDVIRRAEKIVLPGVGAMKPAMARLRSLKLIAPIKSAIAKGKPFLGICLGLQLLFEESEEGGAVKGLGIFKGSVKKFKGIKVPHMGWNQIHVNDRACPIFLGIPDLADVYFCHSYFVNPGDAHVTVTTTDYKNDFTSSVRKGNIFGVQFHPEKSQEVGLKLLKNFIKM